ncbi:hypothetical protein [Microvirga massiliensis]|uniref:hypothetical protein n=1 Tax=Microvirga massiliensis TaxID=1033741 RepID=UPI0011CB8AB2|nr:hypothetical protein [Microvirga massiliensis]
MQHKGHQRLHREAIPAYLCNVFPDPMIKGYFADRGVVVDEASYALSEMLQWIWRSQIRRGDPITAFVLSARMRMLLRWWLDPSKDIVVVTPEYSLAA